MPDPSRSPVPVSLDRAAVERVLARAAELHGVGSDPSEVGALTEAQIVEIAKEAGLSTAHVRQAIAEERTRVALVPESGVAAWLAGPGVAVATRLVPGTPAQVLGTLDRWLADEAYMRIQRRQGERTIWEPRNDVVGHLRRGLRGGDGAALRGIAALAVTVSDAGENRTLVRIDADLTARRRQRLVDGSVTASGGAAAGATMIGVGLVAHALMAVVIPIAILPVAVGVGAATLIARGHRATAERIQTALEHLLDQVERGELAVGRGATPLLDVLQEVRRALR
jgi:hypothetical protein